MRLPITILQADVLASFFTLAFVIGQCLLIEILFYFFFYFLVIPLCRLFLSFSFFLVYYSMISTLLRIGKSGENSSRFNGDWLVLILGMLPDSLSGPCMAFDPSLPDT